jgi:predicted XRE-type DNA-binding protein
MTDDDIEVVRGSGNVFRDFGEPNAELLQLKAILAAKIIGVLDEQRISVRQAHDLTGFAAADFSRVRHAKLQRFTVDRLIEMLVRLGQEVDIEVSVRSRGEAHASQRV